jgi:hypothetical protein
MWTATARYLATRVVPEDVSYKPISDLKYSKTYTLTDPAKKFPDYTIKIFTAAVGYPIYEVYDGLKPEGERDVILCHFDDSHRKLDNFAYIKSFAELHKQGTGVIWNKEVMKWNKIDDLVAAAAAGGRRRTKKQQRRRKYRSKSHKRR